MKFSANFVTILKLHSAVVGHYHTQKILFYD